MSTWQKYQALGGLEKFGVAMGVAGVFGGAYGAFAAAMLNHQVHCKNTT